MNIDALKLILKNTSEALSLSEKAYQVIKTGLKQRILVPGMRLTESELSKALELSRTPLREAIIQLKKEGYLILDDNASLRVRTLTYQNVVDLFQTRRILECAAVRLAAERASGAEEQILSDILAQQLEQINGDKSIAKLSEINEQLHYAILMAARNDYLTQCFEQISYAMTLTDRTRLVEFETNTMMNVYEEHKGIIEAIIAKDSENAVLLMEKHIKKAEKWRLSRLIKQKEGV